MEWQDFSMCDSLQTYPETMPFPIPELNEITMGWPLVGLIVISSLPGNGKSSEGY